MEDGDEEVSALLVLVKPKQEERGFGQGEGLVLCWVVLGEGFGR